MTKEEIQKKRLITHTKRRMSQALDELFVEPQADYAQRITDEIFEEVQAFFEDKEKDGYITDAVVDSGYNSDTETLTIRLQCMLQKPLETVAFTIPVPEGVNAEEFEKSIAEGIEELCKENVE
jgi:hypothetical protein